MMFDVMETLERHSNSIDKLTSIISKNECEKWTEKRLHTSPGFTKIDLEAKVGVDNKIISPATDPLAGIEKIKGIIIITTEITDPTIKIGLGTVTDMMTEGIPIGLMKDVVTTDADNRRRDNYRQDNGNRQKL